MLTLALFASAQAYIYVGNPEAGFHVTLPGTTLTSADAYVQHVRMHYCAGGYDQIAVDDTVDLIAGFSVDVDPGDYCGVSVKWGSDVTFGTSTFSAAYDEPHTSVMLDGSPSEVQAGLTPFELVSGTFPGGVPRLVVSVE